MKRPAKAKRKAKGKANAAKAKRVARQPAEKVAPVYLKQGASIRMGLHDVIKIVKMIDNRGGLAKFTGKLKRGSAEVVVPADTVNRVKDFVADNGMHNTSLGKHVVGGRGTRPKGATGGVTMAGMAPSANDSDPNGCNFGKAERG
jgi:hypothetical protein